MANEYFITSPIAGTLPLDVLDIATTDDLRIPLGTIGYTNRGGRAIYVRSTVNQVSAYAVVRINQDFVADELTMALGRDGGGGVGIMLHALTTNQAGWALLSGKVLIKISGTATPSVPLFTSDTAGGVLSAATATLSGALVMGLSHGMTGSAGVHTATAIFLNGMTLRILTL